MEPTDTPRPGALTLKKLLAEAVKLLAEQAALLEELIEAEGTNATVDIQSHQNLYRFAEQLGSGWSEQLALTALLEDQIRGFQIEDTLRSLKRGPGRPRKFSPKELGESPLLAMMGMMGTMASEQTDTKNKRGRKSKLSEEETALFVAWVERRKAQHKATTGKTLTDKATLQLLNAEHSQDSGQGLFRQRKRVEAQAKRLSKARNQLGVPLRPRQSRN